MKTWACITPTPLVNIAWKVVSSLPDIIDVNPEHGWVRFWKKSAEDEKLLFVHFEGPYFEKQEVFWYWMVLT